MADAGEPRRQGVPRRPGAPPRRLGGPAARRRPGPRPASAPPGPPDRRPGALLVLVRYVLPATVVLAGVVAMAFGTDTSLEGGAGLISAGVAIWLLNWLFRIGARGDAERAAEDRAREYFDRHGHWPPDR